MQSFFCLKKKVAKTLAKCEVTKVVNLTKIIEL